MYSMMENEGLNTHGTIIKVSGGFYTVETARGVLECRARGIFRKENLKPCVGDRADIRLSGDGTGSVERVHARKNELVRPPLSNLDAMVLVLSVSDPEPNLFIADQYIAVLEHKGIEPIIAVTKSDLRDSSALAFTYRQAGFTVFRVSCETGEGIFELKQSLAGKFSAFSGNSGVGKSSLLNAIDPNLLLQVGATSKKLGRGRHTTRTTQSFKLSNGGRVADTPGFSSIDLARMSRIDRNDLQHCFREFAAYINDCRFDDCTHTVEAGCGVLKALDEGKIAETRHKSYKQLYLQIKDIKEWERRG